MLVVKAYQPAKESFGFTANLKSQIAARSSPDTGLITGRSCLESFPTAQPPSPVLAGTRRCTGLREAS